MEVVIQGIILIVGFVLLIKGADFFVDGAASIAENFHLSKMLIGLTIISFGTSAPEFAVSVKSLLSNSGDMIVGNVVGSNILNILLILGISSMFHFLKVKNATVKKEIPIMVLLSLVLAVLMEDTLLAGNTYNEITRADGIILLLFFSVFVYYLFGMMRNKVEEEESNPPFTIPKSIAFTLLGLVAIIFGSNFVVDSASSLAKMIGISERVIALTIVALGTSLPELMTSVMATRKDEYDIAIGNVVGSNIFNIGIVIGLSVSLFGSTGKISFLPMDLIVLLISSICLFLFAYNDYKISKKEGIVFLCMMLFYMGYLFLN